MVEEEQEGGVFYPPPPGKIGLRCPLTYFLRFSETICIVLMKLNLYNIQKFVLTDICKVPTVTDLAVTEIFCCSSQEQSHFAFQGTVSAYVMSPCHR